MCRGGDIYLRIKFPAGRSLVDDVGSGVDGDDSLPFSNATPTNIQ